MIQQRLSEYLNFKSLTYKDFERVCGLSNGTAARLRVTTRKSTFDRIANRSDINIGWLLTGEGEMLRKEYVGEQSVELKERISTFIAYSGKNISELSRFVGFKTPQALRELLAGNTKTLSESALHKISTAYPEINVDWLQTGEGEMLRKEFCNEQSVEIKDRLKHYLTFKKLSVREFERLCGLSNGVASRISKSTNPSTLRRIENNSDLNIDWLLTGEGEMLRKEYAGETEDVGTAEEAKTRVPLIPASAFAGSVKGFAAEAHMLDRCEMINSPVAGAEMAIPITGDSMEPEYPDGSLAYIRKINDAAFIPWGHTVILDTENGAFIKKIYPDNDNESYVWARSINPSYPPMHIPTNSIHNIFRVLGIARIFTTM